MSVASPHHISEWFELGSFLVQLGFISHLAFWDDVLLLLNYIYFPKLLGAEMEHEMKCICDRWQLSFCILTHLTWFLRGLGRKKKPTRGHYTDDPCFYGLFSRQRQLRCGCLKALITRLVEYEQPSLNSVWCKVCCHLAPTSFPSASLLLFLQLVAKQGLM